MNCPNLVHQLMHLYTRTDNKVREFATMCLPWQHWTKDLVWFDEVDISAFHSCVVVDLWKSFFFIFVYM